ncbi:MAG: hypothetical protein K2K55_02110 [Duncaniella sp.]|nr:hypothetical protein [Duncaniella sp.]
MKHLALHIEYLLSSHHCVIVPGLGAFLVNDRAAHYDEERGLFFPPSRDLGFTAEISHNDGLLDQSISRREGLSLDEASKVILSEVAELKCLLEDGNPVGLGRLGELSLQNGSLLFEPSQDALPMMSFKGLSPVPAKIIAEEKSHEQGVVLPKDPGRLGIAVKIVASFLLLFVIGGLVYSTTGLTHSGVVDLASLNSNISPRIDSEEVHQVEISRAIDLMIASPQEEESDIITPAAAVDTPARYLLIVASLESLSSANRHIGDQKDLKIIEMDGKYRVYIDSCPTLNEALALVPSYQDRFESIWICRR